MFRPESGEMRSIRNERDRMDVRVGCAGSYIADWGARVAMTKLRKCSGDLRADSQNTTRVLEAVTQPRVLVVAHGHPEISKGGAEIAAYHLYRGIASRADCKAWFLGCDRRQNRSDIPISQPFDAGSFLYSTGEFDWFRFANRDPRFPKAFTELLTDLSPSVVHFHHYMNVGVEAFWLVRRTLPDAKIVVTLHEYLAICNHHGQMVTHPNRSLCYQATPSKCVECFRELDVSDFFLRKRYIEHFFGFVDHFVSPSAFLAERYVAWGLPESKIMVIENVVVSAKPNRELPPVVDASGPLRIGFFGQFSFLKGANVMFDAAQILDKEECRDITFEVFGDYRNQPLEFQKELEERLDSVGLNVGLHGPYDESRVDGLMQSVDVIVVPSVWWENSPLVIQEAFRNGRPVICSDIGGMAEKVRNGLDGFHFHAGSPLALASLLKRLTDNRQMLKDVAKTIRRPPEPETIIDTHLSLYRGLPSSR
jgi:glycosyltransferase involved in cell wall biosynthesis